MFAIITFRHTGPIKSWSAMRATNVHNARTKPLTHAMPGAPGPEFLVGTNDLVADVKAALRAVKIDPDKLRKNGVIAYEAILSASAEFFDQGTEAERRQRLQDWTTAQRAWAMKHYGAHRVVSMVLHTDEKTPHIHLVVVPLDVKSDRRRTDRELHWSLVGRTISGPGRFDEVQDAYAAAMAPFGLVRGVRGSGRKHEPVPVFVSRMAEKERAVDVAQLDAKAKSINLAREVAATAEDRKRLAVAEADLARRVQAFERLIAEADQQDELRWQRVDADQKIVMAAAAELIERERTLEKARAAHAQQVDDDRARLARQQQALDQFDRDVAAAEDQLTAREAVLDAAKERLLNVFASAQDFMTKVAVVPRADLSPPATMAAIAARDLILAGRAVRPPANELRPSAIASFNAIQQQAASVSW